MKGSEWTTFPTSMGLCGLSWDGSGVTSFQLPEASERHLARLLKKISGQAKPSSAPPPWIRKLVREVKAHINGDLQDFSRVPVHFGKASKFVSSVYSAVRKVPAGKVVTYGELASLIGKPRAFRAVGSALGKNPIPLIVPCHRVVTSDGKLGGFSAPGGTKTKEELLRLEGVHL